MFIDDIKAIADYHNYPVTAKTIDVYLNGYILKVEQGSVNKVTVTNSETGDILYEKFIVFCDDTKIFIKRLKNYLEFVRDNKGPQEDLVEWLINDIDTSDYYKDVFKKFESDISELHIKWDKYLEELK